MSEPEVIYDWMSPNEKRGRAYRNNGVVERRVRPCDVHFELSAEEQAELAALSLHQRQTRYREMKQAYMDTR